MWSVVNGLFLFSIIFQVHFQGLAWAAPTACSGPALVGRDAPPTVLSEPWLPGNGTSLLRHGRKVDSV